MNCTPEDVFAVLADGWLYGMWVVGAARIRDVDGDWPAPGSSIHHSVGAWPVLLSDETTSARADSPHLLELTVKAWPTGEARVTLLCNPHGDGQTEVIMEEQAVSGPAALLPKVVQDVMLGPRNREALRRLAHLAENHARTPA